MSKQKGGSGRREAGPARWAMLVTAFTFVITVALGLLASSLFTIIPIAGAFALQLLLVCAGVFSDLIGIAVATADLPPFLSMAAKKVRGADRAIWLIKNAERVTNIFNDVLGDIFGVLSGATGATIVAMIAAMLVQNRNDVPAAELYAGIAMTSLVAAMMVGGKAAGKAFAMKNSREIVLRLGRLMSLFSPGNRKTGRKHQGNA